MRDWKHMSFYGWSVHPSGHPEPFPSRTPSPDPEVGTFSHVLGPVLPPRDAEYRDGYPRLLSYTPPGYRSFSTVPQVHSDVRIGGEFSGSETGSPRTLVLRLGSGMD